MTTSKTTLAALTLSFAAALATPAAAQELSLGYQMQRFTSGGDSLNAPFGVNISVAGSGPVTLVGQLDWSRKRESQTVLGTSVDATADFTAFAGGVRMSGRNPSGVTPFVEALFGAMRSSGSARVAGQNVGSASQTDRMWEVGAGVSVPMVGGFGVFGQFDYRRILDDDASVNGVRFVAGVRLGR